MNVSTMQDLLEVNNVAVDELVYGRIGSHRRRLHPPAPELRIEVASSPERGQQHITTNNNDIVVHGGVGDDDDCESLKSLQLFTGCLHTLQTHLRQQDQQLQLELQRQQQHPCKVVISQSVPTLSSSSTNSNIGGSVDDDSSSNTISAGPSIETSSLASIFDYALCGIDSTYFVYTNSIKFRLHDDSVDLHDDHQNNMDIDDEVDNDDDLEQEQQQQLQDLLEDDSEVVAAVLLFNIAQVYHIRGLQQQERQEEEHPHEQQANATVNLLKAERMYVLAIHLMHRRVEEFDFLLTSNIGGSGTTSNSACVPFLITLGAMNNLATLQLRRGDQDGSQEARITFQHLLRLMCSLSSSPAFSLSTLSSHESYPEEHNSLAGLIRRHEWHGMISNCMLILFHMNGQSSSASSSSSSSNDHCDNIAPAA
jgi:hypothetical protein